MTREEQIARVIYAVVYGLGSDRTFDKTQPVYRTKCFEAAQRVLEIMGEPNVSVPKGQAGLFDQSE